MVKRYIILLIGIITIIVVGNSSDAYAHLTLNVRDIEVEVGWLNEPPLVGIMNGITLEFTRNAKPFIIEPSELSVSVKYGGVSRALELQPLGDGKYVSPIIPTRTGSYVVVLKGSVGGYPVNAEVPIEDVEDKSGISFPDATESTDVQRLIPTLQSSLIQLQNKADKAAKEAEEAKRALEEIKSTIESINNDAERAYNFGIMGLSVGIAGVAIGIAVMTRRGRP